MAKIGFNPKALSAVTPHGSDVRHASVGCAFEPVVVSDAGIEAIIKGLRLAHVEGFERPAEQRRGQLPAKDVDP